MKEVIMISMDGGHYSTEQAVERSGLTAGELRDLLSDAEEDTPVVIYMGGYGVTHFRASAAEIEEAED